MRTTNNTAQGLRHLRVFLASPGDVTQERTLALQTLDELQYEPLLRHRITVETVAWDKPGAGAPMLTTLTPQEAIEQGLPKPSECDIVIVIFWSRMGTPLPAEYQKSDGSRYLSGTEWEFLNALEAAKRAGKPEILVYRRSEKIALDPDDPAFEDKARQWREVNNFFATFLNPDASIRRSWNNYLTPEAFQKDLRLHLQALIQRLVPELQSAPKLKQGVSFCTRRTDPGSDILPLEDGKKYLSIGVDIGTTKIAASLIKLSKNGFPEYNYANIIRMEHDEKRNAEGVLDKIVTVISDTIAKEGISKRELDAIGLGLPGQVRRTDGWLRFAPGLQIRNFNFCTKLQKTFGVPVYADNDVNCSTLAELVYGCQGEYDDFICIFVGTGIGAGVVVNRRMIRGHNFSAGEIGHMKIDFRPDARDCTCGQKGCFEEYASARAVIRLARIRIFDIIERKIDSALRELDPRTIEPREIVSFIRKGDEEARELANEIANYLSIGLANIAMILNPQAIILGGGIIEGFFDLPEFEKAINRKFKDYAIPECATTGLVRSSFKCSESGNPAPMIGATLLPFDELYAYSCPADGQD